MALTFSETKEAIESTGGTIAHCSDKDFYKMNECWEYLLGKNLPSNVFFGVVGGLFCHYVSCVSEETGVSIEESIKCALDVLKRNAEKAFSTYDKLNQ